MSNAKFSGQFCRGCNNDVVGLPLELIESFIAVAEELHLGRAAARIHVSEPAMSRQLARLERALGVQLFRRTTRRMEMTSAGAVFLARVKPGLELLQQAHEEALRTTAGTEGLLRVAYRPAVAVHLLPEVLKAHRERYPRVAVSLIDLDEELQGQELRSGHIDLAFARFRVAGPGLASEALYEEPLAVALPRHHSFANRSSLSLTELADEDYVLWTRALADERHDALHRAFSRAGFVPRVVLRTGDPLSALSLVRVGLGISVIAFEYRHLGRADVVLVPLRNTGTTTYAAWRAGAAALIERFLDTVREQVRMDHKPAASRGARVRVSA